MQIKKLIFFLIRRLLKLDTNAVKVNCSDEKPTALNNLKRKKLINLRENLHLNTVTPSNETIPKKLLFELASLSDLKFRIEIRSKYQSLVLPLMLNNRNYSENDNLVSLSENVKIEQMDENKSVIKSSSPLDNDYITLKCQIINENVALVPPINILTPYSYPESNPIVDCIQLPEFDDDMLPEYSN